MFKTYYTAYLIYQAIAAQPPIEICALNTDRLIEQLKRHEGVEHLPYIDTQGKMTIGIGRNLSDRGISISTINQMLMEDIELATSDLERVYPEYCDLSEDRQLVLANMSFNLGIPRYLKFEKFWAALRQGQWDLAATEMLDSRWAKQVGDRATELADMMRKG